MKPNKHSYNDTEETKRYDSVECRNHGPPGTRIIGDRLRELISAEDREEEAT